MDQIVHKLVHFSNIHLHIFNDLLLIIFLDFFPVLSTSCLFRILLSEIGVYVLVGVGSHILNCSATSILNHSVNFYLDDVAFISF